jgi:hypothetical protein
MAFVHQPWKLAFCCFGCVLCCKPLITASLKTFACTQVVEKAQRRHLEGKTKSRFPKDAPGWDEELASDSEAIVKAERSTHDTADIKEMQRETVECLAQEKEELGEGTPNVKDEQGPR